MKKQLSRYVACICFGLGAGNAAAVEMTVKWEDGSPTYKAGANYSGLFLLDLVEVIFNLFWFKGS
jgi:hypothetical protein